MTIKNLIKRILGIKSPAPDKVGGSNESTRIAWIEQTLLRIPAGGRILDAGAGEQPFKKYCKHLLYVSQDFAAYNPDEVEKGLQMNNWDYGKLDIVSDIASIPEPNASFDAIMCTEVFEHVINPLDAVKEFSRLLKQNGYLILSSPFCSLTHFAPYHFYSGFNRFFYETALADNGFEIIELLPNGNYFEYMAQELYRLPWVAEKYSKETLSQKEKVMIWELLASLQRFSDKDTGSSELLCFGYHVLARKK